MSHDQSSEMLPSRLSTPAHSVSSSRGVQRSAEPGTTSCQTRISSQSSSSRGPPVWESSANVPRGCEQAGDLLPADLRIDPVEAGGREDGREGAGRQVDLLEAPDVEAHRPFGHDAARHLDQLRDPARRPRRRRPRSTSARVSLPVPQPISTTVSPDRSPRASRPRSTRAAGYVGRTRSYSSATRPKRSPGLSLTGEPGATRGVRSRSRPRHPRRRSPASARADARGPGGRRSGTSPG